jgi:G3E family GTPase
MYLSLEEIPLPESPSQIKRHHHHHHHHHHHQKKKKKKKKKQQLSFHIQSKEHPCKQTDRRNQHHICQSTAYLRESKADIKRNETLQKGCMMQQQAAGGSGIERENPKP